MREGPSPISAARATFSPFPRGKPDRTALPLKNLRWPPPHCGPEPTARQGSRGSARGPRHLLTSCCLPRRRLCGPNPFQWDRERAKPARTPGPWHTPSALPGTVPPSPLSTWRVRSPALGLGIMHLLREPAGVPVPFACGTALPPCRSPQTAGCVCHPSPPTQTAGCVCHPRVPPAPQTAGCVSPESLPAPHARRLRGVSATRVPPTRGCGCPARPACVRPEGRSLRRGEAAARRTLPKLPLPSTIRKLKSVSFIRSLLPLVSHLEVALVVFSSGVLGA